MDEGKESLVYDEDPVDRDHHKERRDSEKHYGGEMMLSRLVSPRQSSPGSEEIDGRNVKE